MNLDRIIKRYLVPLLLLLLLATAYNEFFIRRGHWQPPDERSARQPLQQPAVETTRGPLLLGERFTSLAELDTRQKNLGWLRVGRFGDGWPAEVVELTEDEDGIKFVLADGTPHRYEKFDGYRLQIVRLQGDGEVLLVYRSQHKRG